MAELHEILAERVTGWRAAAYPHASHPAIAENSASRPQRRWLASLSARAADPSARIYSPVAVKITDMLGEEALVVLERVTR